MPHYSSTSDSHYEEQRSGTSQKSPVLPPNPYSVLGVSENAEPSEIRKAYLKLILRHHPDKAEDGERGTSVEEFCKIKEAYDLINDEARLAEYKEQEQSEPKSQARAPRSGASQPRASTSETSTNRHSYPSLERNSTTLPLRPFYKRCEICLNAYCYDVHRWFTRFGYIKDLTSRGFSLKGARILAEEHYGEWDDFDVCEVCYERNCAYTHRMFTQEGFMWEQLKFLSDLSDDAIVAADIRAREEFGDVDFSSRYGGRDWSGHHGTAPRVYTYGCYSVSQGRTGFYESTLDWSQQRYDDSSKYDRPLYRIRYVVPSYTTRYDSSYRTRYDSPSFIRTRYESRSYRTTYE